MFIYLYMYIYIYIYIYVERERHVCIYIYMYAASHDMAHRDNGKYRLRQYWLNKNLIFVETN